MITIKKRHKMLIFWSKYKSKFLKNSFIILSLAFIITIVLLFFIPGSPVMELFSKLLLWITSVPTQYSALIFMGIYCLFLLFILPGTPLNLASGYLYGLGIGSLVSCAGCDAGAVISFFVGRYLMRGWVKRKMEKNPKLAAIDGAIKEKGLLIIFLLRLSPIMPFGMCNYILGVTNVTFWQYWYASTAGLIPATVGYTYAGTLMKDISEMWRQDGTDTSSLIYLCIGIVSTIILVIFITKVSKNALLSKQMEASLLSQNKHHSIQSIFDEDDLDDLILLDQITEEKENVF